VAQKILSVLGLPTGASEAQVKSTYKRLIANLSSEHFIDNARASEQAEIAKAIIEETYQEFFATGSRILMEDKLNSIGTVQSHHKPRLGQLCVASGMISIDQLKEAVEAQVTNKIPLGEILQSKKFISQGELDALLLGQQMIDVPDVENEPSDHRLVLLGIANEDMILVLQMEQKTLGLSMRELLTRHRWVEPAVLDALEYNDQAS
jgi:hypothetical protein